MDDRIPVVTVYVSPLNRSLCHYVINDSQMHTKDYESLQEFLIGLMPDKAVEIADLIARKVHFLLLPQDNTVQELKFDLDKENKALAEKILHSPIKTIERTHIQAQNPNNPDSIMKGLSRGQDSTKGSYLNNVLKKVLK